MRAALCGCDPSLIDFPEAWSQDERDGAAGVLIAALMEAGYPCEAGSSAIRPGQFWLDFLPCTYAGLNHPSVALVRRAHDLAVMSVVSRSDEASSSASVGPESSR